MIKEGVYFLKPVYKSRTRAQNMMIAHLVNVQSCLPFQRDLSLIKNNILLFFSTKGVIFGIRLLQRDSPIEFFMKWCVSWAPEGGGLVTFYSNQISRDEILQEFFPRTMEVSLVPGLATRFARCLGFTISPRFLGGWATIGHIVDT